MDVHVVTSSNKSDMNSESKGARLFHTITLLQITKMYLRSKKGCLFCFLPLFLLYISAAKDSL